MNELTRGRFKKRKNEQKVYLTNRKKRRIIKLPPLSSSVSSFMPLISDVFGLIVMMPCLFKSSAVAGSSI